MKVGHLMARLSLLDKNSEIFVSHDGEGNSFSNPGSINVEEGFYILYPDDSYYNYEDLP
jgi:hypothetical protein